MEGKGKSLFLLIVLISCAGMISGGEEGEEKHEQSLDELLEEVSIEAVEDNDEDIPTLLAEMARNSGEDSVPSQSVAQSQSDNSTAVATVYHVEGLTPSSKSNSTTNSTTGTPSRYLRVKVACSRGDFNASESEIVEDGAVELVNITYLMHKVLVINPTIKTRSTPSNCTVIFFYTHWCPWSAKAAPHFNALPRAFKNIRFVAIDSSVYTHVNTYYGILSVPTVVLFYNGKIHAKFNDTNFSVNQLAEFISAFTDQKPGIRLNVTSIDFVGPIPSSISNGHDWYLYLSWTFILACCAYYMSRTALWHRLLEIFQNSWREAEAVASVPPHHYHQD